MILKLGTDTNEQNRMAANDRKADSGSDGSDYVLSQREYGPYGETYSNNGMDLIHGYTGHVLMGTDSDYPLYYAPYRNYSPNSARWTSRDPLGMVDGTNEYGYVRDNPIVWTDPSGAICGADDALEILAAEELIGLLVVLLENWANGPLQTSIGKPFDADIKVPRGCWEQASAMPWNSLWRWIFLLLCLFLDWHKVWPF